MSDQTAATTFGGAWQRRWRRLAARVVRIGSVLRPATLLAALEAEQERWFLWLPVLIGCGIGTYFALPVEPPLAIAAGGLAVSLGLWLATGRQPGAGQGLRLIAGIGLAMAIGFGAAQARTIWIGTPVLARATGTVGVSGWIEDVEARGNSAYRIIVRVAAIDGLTGPAAELPWRVRVRVPGAAKAGGSGLRIGAPVRLRARLTQPPLPALPGDYDFARRAYFMMLGAVGYGRSPPEPAPDLGPPPWTIAIWAPGENLRRVVAERINSVLSGDRAAITIALIQGDQGGISPQAMNTMRNSGLAHILSISGLHMAIVAGALFWAIRALLALSPFLAQNYPVRAMAAVCAGFGALFYLMLSGWQVPAVRSFVMIAIMFLAIVLTRPALSLRNVALAALVLLVLRPENLLDVSFLMSFAATTGLVALYEEIGARRRDQVDPPEPAGPMRRMINLIGADLLTTFVAGLSVAPLGAYFFHTYQQYAALGNLLALPICSLWLMPGVLIVLLAMPLGLEAIPLQLMAYGVDALLAVGAWVASLPGSVSAIPAMPLAAVNLMMLGGLWIALWQRPWRWLGLVAVGFGCWKALDRIPPDVLIGRDGEALAIRQADGRLSAIGGKRGAYELQRWLEHDGDRRAIAVAAQGQGFRCDTIGCTARVAGLTMAYVTHPAGLQEDCGKADIIVLRFPRGRSCRDGRLVIDLVDLRRLGTHVIRIENGEIRLQTLADYRGTRPWTSSRRPAPLPRPAPGPDGTAAHERLFEQPLARERDDGPREREERGGADPW